MLIKKVLAFDGDASFIDQKSVLNNPDLSGTIDRLEKIALSKL
ncbi:MAG: hypothetical protein ACRYFB_13465 [Janthinobacterium lividum]